MTFFSDMCAMVLAHPRALFPAVAVLWYGGDAKTIGLLVAAPAARGAARRGVLRLAGPDPPARAGDPARRRPPGAAPSPSSGSPGNLWLGLFFLALAGCADTVSMVFRNTMMQAADPGRDARPAAGRVHRGRRGRAPARGLPRRARSPT